MTRSRSRSSRQRLFGRTPGLRERTRCHRVPRVLAPGHHFDKIKIVKPHEAISALSALASEARLAVFRLLVKRGPAGYTPSELTDRLGVPAPTLSFHLKELGHAGLIVSRREGRNLFYSPSVERMSALVAFLTENCCSLADEACGPDCRPVAATTQRKRA